MSSYGRFKKSMLAKRMVATRKADLQIRPGNSRYDPSEIFINARLSNAPRSGESDTLGVRT
jgi:hypothetical protein